METVEFNGQDPATYAKRQILFVGIGILVMIAQPSWTTGSIEIRESGLPDSHAGLSRGFCFSG